MTGGASAAAPRFVLFGGVGVRAADGEVADVGGRKQQAVLALLLLEPGRVVVSDRIVDALWGDAPPARPEVSIRGYVSNLRRALAGLATIDWRHGGYVIDADADDIDVLRFERLVDRAGDAVRAGRPHDAADAVGRASELRVGRPFGGLGDEAPFATIAVRLDERSAQLDELIADVGLAAGEAAGLVGPLTAAVAAEPFRERRRTQLALALYRAGRPVDALRSLDAARAFLRDEVGVDPGPELVRMHHAILDHDPTLAWRPPAAASGPPATDRFVGRRAELGRIAGALEGVSARGAVVIISGEAGIGKTALARQAVGRMAGVPVVWGRGLEAAVDAPYGVWTAVAQQLVRLGVIEPTPAAGEQPLVTYAAIARSLQRAGEPFAVVVDDLQWVDAATLGVLELLAGEVTGLPMALVVTVRTPDVEVRPAALACLTELGRADVAHRIDLSGLDVTDVGSWLAEHHGDGGRDALARVVHDRTGGHPFFIRELVALLAGEGASAAAAERSMAAGVPAAVHDVVRRRVSSLPAATQQLMAAAAVLGRRVDLGVLAGVVDEPIDAVLAGLEPAMAAGLLRPDADRVGQLLFSHALVADALRAEQTAAGLARRHAAVAAVIERRWAGDLDTVIDELAIHAHAGAAAGTAAAAVEHGARAAALATAANAPADAAAHLSRALDALAVLAPGDRARRQGLATDLGIALAAAGDAMGGRAALVEAAAIADARGDVDGVVRALRHVNGDDLWSSLDWSEYDERTTDVIRRALDRTPAGEPSRRAELTAALASELYAVDVGRALALAAEAVDLAAGVDDPLVQARVLLRQCWAAWRPAGQPLRAVAGDRLVELAASGALPARFRPLAHLTRFVAAYEVGDAAVADRHVALARATADPVRTPAEWTYLLYAEWSLLVARGRVAEALAAVDGVHDAMRRSRRVVAGVTRAGLRAQAYVELGRTDEALGALDDVVSTPYAASGEWWRAWALARGGRLDEAAGHLRAFDGPLPDDWYRAPLLCAALHAAALVGDAEFTARHVEVLRPHQDHVAIAGSGGLVLGPVALAVARADVVLGDPVAARRSLERAEVVARRMGSAPWLAQIADVGAQC